MLPTKTIEVTGQFNEPGVFPTVIAADSESASLSQACEWVGAHKERLLEQLDADGALLLRDFPVRTDRDFDTVIQAFGVENFAYADSLSNAVRVNRTERVFTANEAPPDVSIYMHHEMAQTPIFPAKLFFFCEKAAEQAGQTPICRSDWLLQRLVESRPEFVAQCRRHGVRYFNTMPADDDAQSGQGRSWRSTLRVETLAEAEIKLRELGYQWHWLDDGSLRATTPVLPAIRQMADGREVFFNQLIAAFRGWKDTAKAIAFGDMSEIDKADMEHVCDIADALTFDIPWQDGDIVVADNFLVMHGRRPFGGTRRILVSLVADDGSRLAA
ncbi:MAG: TauD/TfdA family dioxygenase [Pseudomonadota bacterium]